MANYNSIKKKTDEEAKVKIEQSNKIFDDQYAATEKIYNEQIKQSDASYARSYDRANVRRIVNERYAKEMAANMGLSNSGYNLTQQTQIMLSYGNAVLETDMQKNAAANSIRQQLAGVKADIEAQKSQSAFNIQNAYDQQAVDTYNQQVADENAAARARESALAAERNNLQTIIKGCLEFNDDNKLAAYLDSLVYAGVISYDTADTLYANYKTSTPVLNKGDGYTYGAPDAPKYGYTKDYGTLYPGRNGWSIRYSDGTTRAATDAEVKAGKGLTAKPIANKAPTKSNINTNTNSNPIDNTTWDYSKYSFK